MPPRAGGGNAGAQNCDFYHVWNIEQNETNRNKANRYIFTVFYPLGNKSINHKAKHRQNVNKHL